MTIEQFKTFGMGADTLAHVMGDGEARQVSGQAWQMRGRRTDDFRAQNRAVRQEFLDARRATLDVGRLGNIPKKILAQLPQVQEPV